MTPIDYLVLAGFVLAGGYVVARLFVGWLRCAAKPAEIEPDHADKAPIVSARELERVDNTAAPWHLRT